MKGVQEEILGRLAKGRRSESDFAHIDATLQERAGKSSPDREATEGVAHILEGSVQKSADQVRVHVQLIKAANDSHLWADTLIGNLMTSSQWRAKSPRP